MGAGSFCNDSNMHPIRGHLVKVKAPWIKNCLMLGMIIELQQLVCFDLKFASIFIKKRI